MTEDDAKTSAAEMVETTGRYLRCCAKIDPRWIEPLAGHGFRIWRQTRTGLLSYPLDPTAARSHVSASVYLQMALRPHIIHVVGYSEAHHAATAGDVIESCGLARRAIENAQNRARMLVRPNLTNAIHGRKCLFDLARFAAFIWATIARMYAARRSGLKEERFGYVPGGYARVLEKADAAAALGVAVIVLFVSYKLGRRTIDVLIDTAPDGPPQKIVEAAAGVEGVLRTGQVRVRR